eukprot:10367665-Heterocapsa_arctica.AAC.1
MGWFFVEGFGPGVTFDTLADSGGEHFMSLDLKLSTSLGTIVRAGPATLASQLMAKAFDSAARGRMIM